MIDFWLPAGLMLLVALAFLALPAVRGRRAQVEEDRTALNVALYQERQAELRAQHAAGTLDAERLDAGLAEAARELLADTDDSAEPRATARLGRWVPLLAALLVPLCALGLYLHWGSSAKVELARELREAPRSLDDMTSRLERVVQVQPDSADSWYFLGRAYMAQERPADAAKAYERAVALAGRQPELLGQWAQALYFAANKRFEEPVRVLTEEALRADPREATSLGLMGIDGFERGDYRQAVEYWTRLLAALPPEDPSRDSIQGGIERAREKLGETAATAQVDDGKPSAAAEGPTLKARVSLSADLQGKVQPGDSVFVFARAASGPPMPLAAKRLTVADLPVDVSLSDADAMMPQLRLSQFPQVQLVARVSRAGDATRGEWIGRSATLSNATAEPQNLIIDSPDAK
ncbi:c-type cytochrome biogenesis protein CcmI [Pseudomonas mangiferae]|uniref:C-type cytochrome biogenesis protein CcmI n=1 Tax=Pseudomonas mangiferae TaxID=2593654 RepID=A0A553GY32_9PSED|nr:c-type cytochrome biogenesis protein CcmI [Pseudomonas mangiferae]TRX74406.1 c-type cytochrome biogenesis protein CcmI [Pseudomonas mangiferae]